MSVTGLLVVSTVYTNAVLHSATNYHGSGDVTQNMYRSQTVAASRFTYYEFHLQIEGSGLLMHVSQVQ